MIKAGIITILNVNNYGAELQAYALYRKMSDLGIDSEIINYLYYTNPKHIEENESLPMVKISLKNKLKWKAQKVQFFLTKIIAGKNASVRAKRFEQFHVQNTKLTKEFRSIKELYAAVFDYDVFVVGSDQVWNPRTLTSLKPYFLTFAPQNKRKVSYASSFGVSSLEPQNYAVYKECLNNINILSCRERQGVELIQKVTGREAVHVLDPTLLLKAEEWETVLKPTNISEPYILLYELTSTPYIVKLANHISKVTGHKIVRLCKNALRNEHDNVILNITDAGPSEYLGLFKSASFVLTNSFHGTVFSVLFKKPFFTIIPSHNTNNSRQQGFLELVGLEKRLLKEDSDFLTLETLNIDYVLPHQKLETEREKSIQYLKNAVQG